MPGLGGPHAAQQGPDAGRQLLRCERLGEVVVGAGFESGDDVVRVVAGGHHHDGDVAGAADRAAQLESVDARQHDVDQHDVGLSACEQLDRLLTALCLVDGPTLVLERELDGRADAFVVLDGKDSCAHGAMMPEIRRGTHS